MDFNEYLDVTKKIQTNWKTKKQGFTCVDDYGRKHGFFRTYEEAALFKQISHMDNWKIQNDVKPPLKINYSALDIMGYIC